MIMGMRCFILCRVCFFSFFLSFVPGTGIDGVGDDITNSIIMLCCVLCLILENKVNRALVYMF